MGAKRAARFVLVVACIYLSSTVGSVRTAAQGAIISGTTTQLTANPLFQLDAAISGDFVVWTDHRNGNDDIYACIVVDCVASTFQVTTASTDERSPDISENTFNISVYTDVGPPSHVHVFDTGLGFDYGFISPDNAQNARLDGLIAVYEVAVPGDTDVWMTDLATFVSTPIANTAIPELGPSVFGKRIVYERRAGSPDFGDIVLYDVTTSLETVIAVGPSDQRRPDINGSFVVYDATTAAGDTDIFVFNITTGSTAQVVRPGNQRRARVSGDVVAFESDEGHLDIWLYHIPSGTVSPVATDPAAQEFLDDIGGNHIVYTSDASGNLDIWMFTFALPAPPTATCFSPFVTANISSGTTCTANASIDEGSSDPNGLPITAVQNPPGPYPEGATPVTLTVTNSAGLSSQCSATVTVTCALVCSAAPPPATGATDPPLFHPFIEQAKLTASNGAANDQLGLSVAMSRDTIVIGAPASNSRPGAAYVFVKSPGTGWTTATETAKLTASDGAPGNFFGRSVAISGDTVLVGANGEVSGRGSAYVFVKPAGGWTTTTETAKLTASDGLASDAFGASVAISGGTAVVASPGDDSLRGSAYVFVEPAGGWTTTTETAKLTASDGVANDFFNRAAVSGDTVIIGAIGPNERRGSAYVFVEPVSGWVTMTETAKLTASDAVPNDLLGVSVAISGDTVLIGAEGDDSNLGSAYVFVKPAGGWVTTTEIAKLTASDGVAGASGFGGAVAITDDAAIVGARFVNSRQGAAYLFVPSASGWTTTTETQKVTAADGLAIDLFGASVGLSGDTVVIGAPGDDIGANSNQGSAYVFNDPVNDPPVAQGQTVTLDEDTALALRLTGNEKETSAADLSFAIVTVPQHGTLSGTAPDVVYTPNPDYSGPDSFTFTVTDRGDPDGCVGAAPGCAPPLTSAEATVAISIRAVNDAPVAVAQEIGTNEDTDLPLTLTGIDAETPPAGLTVVITSNPAHGTLSGTPPNLTYTPAPDYNGPDSFTFTVTDRGDPDGCSSPACDCAPALTSASGTVAISVTPVNDPPVADGQIVSTDEDTARTLTLGSDKETSSADLTFTITVPPQHGTLSVTPPNVSYKPDADYNGPDSFTFTVTDRGDPDTCGAPTTSCAAASTSAAAQVSITVKAVNDVPSFTKGADQTVLENAGAQTVPNWATSISAGPANESLQALTFLVGNNKPELFSIQPAIDAAGTLTYTPKPDANGVADVTVRLRDDGGTADGGVDTSADQPFTITVTAVNDRPVSTSQTLATNEDTQLTITLTGRDIDNSTLSFSTTTPGRGTLGPLSAPSCTAIGAGGRCTATATYTPLPNYSGPDSFTYRVNDGSLDSPAATVTLTIRPVNDAPVNSVPGPQVTTRGRPLVFSTAGHNRISIADVDAGANPVRVTLTATNGHLTLSGTTGLTFVAPSDGSFDSTMTFTGTIASINAALEGLIFIPSLFFTGSASVTITTDDLGASGAGGALSDTDTVPITITP